MAIGIYKIQSLIYPDRVYIGSAVDFNKRWSKHRRDLEKNKHHSVKLQYHYNKYGKEDLVYSILMECDKDKVIRKEQCFINIYQPWFNVSPTAGSTQGIKYGKEFKEKVSAFHKGRNHTEKHKERIALAQMGENNSFYGKHHSEESKQAKRDWNLKNGVKPPGYHGGSKKGRIYKKKTAA